MPDSFSIYDAKTNFSMIIRDSAERGKVFVVGNAQAKASQKSIIMGEAAVRLLLDNLTCSPAWEEDPELSRWTVYVSEIDAWGEGDTKEDATSDLVQNAKALSEAYLEESALYFKFGRTEVFPYMLKVGLARDDLEVQRVLGL